MADSEHLDRQELNAIAVNAQLTDHDPDSLLERFTSLNQASMAIAEAYLGTLSQEVKIDKNQLPDFFDHAVNYAANLIYKTGNPFFNDDITRTMENEREWAKLRDDKDWQPTSEVQINLSHELIHIGSLLAAQDKGTAYNSHVEGRNHEILDPYDTRYNKFGTIVYPKHD